MQKCSCLTFNKTLFENESCKFEQVFLLLDEMLQKTAP